MSQAVHSNSSPVPIAHDKSWREIGFAVVREGRPCLDRVGGLGRNLSRRGTHAPARVGSHREFVSRRISKMVFCTVKVPHI